MGRPVAASQSRAVPPNDLFDGGPLPVTMVLPSGLTASDKTQS